MIGLGTYTFLYAKGYSYLTNNPEACANCHVMHPYEAWLKSSHHSVASCNVASPVPDQNTASICHFAGITADSSMPPSKG